MTNSGVSVCSFTVAVNRRKKDRDGNELPAMFYRVTVWRQLAEICGKFLQKGSKVYVDGDLSTSQFQKNDGSTGFSLEIDCQNIEFLSGTNNHEQNSHAHQEQKDEQNGFTKVETEELPF